MYKRTYQTRNSISTDFEELNAKASVQTSATIADNFITFESIKITIVKKNTPTVHENTVFWNKNLFLIQSGKAGRELIDELSRLMHEADHTLKMG